NLYLPKVQVFFLSFHLSVFLLSLCSSVVAFGGVKTPLRSLYPGKKTSLCVTNYCDITRVYTTYRLSGGRHQLLNSEFTDNTP
ncbi:hypothetical protein LINPERHAP1_LOCUS27776, partial [Linum perenne]